jgi:hypothetical protein
MCDARGRLVLSMPSLDGVDVVINTDERDADEVAAVIHAEMARRGLIAEAPAT